MGLFAVLKVLQGWGCFTLVLETKYLIALYMSSSPNKHFLQKRVGVFSREYSIVIQVLFSRCGRLRSLGLQS